MSSEVELRKVATELLEVAKSFLNIAQHCKIASGVCGCGEEMDGHSHPMSAGHSPTDMANQVVNKTIADAEAAIEAYNQLRRSASPSIGRVGVKALEWQGDKAETPFGPYTVIRTPDGYQSRFQRDEVAHVGFNAVDMFYGARRAAQDHAQADYESRIRSTLVYHEEPAGDTQGAAKLVAWRAITVAGNVLYFAANDKPVEPSWEIIPLYAAPAALVSPPDNGGWMPIETAPRDQNVLVYFRDAWDNDRVQEAWWKSPYEGAPLDRCAWETMKGTLLSADVHFTIMDGEHRPLGATHWRPLPSPPALQSHNEGSDGK